jgi:hypothetical protein
MSEPHTVSSQVCDGSETCPYRQRRCGCPPQGHALPDFAQPPGLCADGVKAWETITKFLIKRHITYTGGCTTFYSPEQWKARDEEYGTRGVLIVVYDGGEVRPVFNMDAAYAQDFEIRAAMQEFKEPLGKFKPYEALEAMQDELKKVGLYSDECTGWYSAVYKKVP